VVVRDCAPNGLYVGSPARRVRDLDETPPAALAVAVRAAGPGR
jgi:acetyltransferase-like isoleucine patch superfamily enzyme